MSTSWETTHSKVAFTNSWLSLHLDTLKHPSSHRPYEYTYIKRRHHGVVIIPYFPKTKSVLLTCQYRHPVGRSIWQFPGGGQEPGTTPRTTAQKELLEETNFRAKKLTLLGKITIDPGIISNLGFIYLALNPVKSKASRIQDPQEIVSAKLFPLTKFESMITSGRIRDGWTLSAYTLFYLYLNQ